MPRSPRGPGHRETSASRVGRPGPIAALPSVEAALAGGPAGTYDGILDLQGKAGNRAVSSAVGRVVQLEVAGDAVDPRYRAQRLREAIHFQVFPKPQWMISLAAAREALGGLTAEEGRRVKDEYRRQEGQDLAWIISGVAEVNGTEVGNNLSRADRVELGNLLRGTVLGPPGAAGPAEAARVSSSRWNALAGQFKAALDRHQADDAIGLIPGTAAERKLLQEAYVRLFGGDIKLAVITSLGNEAPRAIATWAGATAVADRFALESAAAAKEKADAQTDELATKTASILGDSTELRKGIAKRRREASEKLESKVRRVREREGGAKHLEEVLGASPGLARRVGVGHDPVVTAIAAGNVGGELGAGLARKDREGDVSIDEAEATIRQLRELAETAAEAEVNQDPTGLEGRRDEITRRLAGQYWAAFEQAYVAAAPRRPLRDLVSGSGGDKQRVLEVAGLGGGQARAAIEESAGAVRNRALLRGRGQIPAWQELFLALNRDPKDMDRVHAVLDPLTRTEVDQLALQYLMHTGGRTLERDLVGTPMEQEAARWLGAGKERERQREGAVLLRGGRFDKAAAEAALPAGLDREAREAALLQAEGRFLFGRIADLERRVTENRGAFAYARDWAGNEERELLQLARRDGTDAKSALENALLRHDDAGHPDLAEARRQLRELRRVQYRLEHATTVYKASTQKAFDEFVDLAVNATSFVAGLMPGGAIIALLRTTAATVGTKLVLKGSDYTPAEFGADIEAAIAGGVGDLAKLPVKQLATWTASKMAPLVTRLGIPATFARGVRRELGEMAIRQAEHTVSTAAQNIALGKGPGEGQGLGDRVTGEIKHYTGEAIKSVAGWQETPEGGTGEEEQARKQLGAGEESSAGQGTHGDGESADVRPREAGDTAPKPDSDDDGGSAIPVPMRLPDEAVPTIRDEHPPAGMTTADETPTSTVGAGDELQTGTAGTGDEAPMRTAATADEAPMRTAATAATQDEAPMRTAATADEAPNSTAGTRDAPAPRSSPGGRPPGEIPFQPPPGFKIAKHQALETPRALAEAQDNPSKPRAGIFTAYRRRRFRRTSQKPGEGQSEQHILVDTVSGKKYLFKPSSGEPEVDRAAERGIEAGDYAGRAKAAELVANQLGIVTPPVKLAVVDGMPGSLTEWVDGYTSLMKITDRDVGEGARVRSDPEFKRQLARIDALDYLINNLDRGGNYGNYMVKLNPDGSVAHVMPIDHDLTFTASKARALIENRTRGLPHSYEPDMVRNLDDIAANREAFARQIEPLVGKEAVAGVLARLDELVKDAHAKTRRGAGRP